MTGWRLSLDKHQRYVLPAIILLAFLLRGAFSLGLYPRLAGPLGLGQDPDYFGQLALNWASGQGYVFYPGDPPSTFRGPGYPLLLVALYALFGQPLPAALFVQSLLGALLCLPVFYIGRRVDADDEESASVPVVGCGAALVCATYPLLIWYTPRLQYEPLPYPAVDTGCLVDTQSAGGEVVMDRCGAGLLVGCAALVNQATLLLPPLLFGISLLVERLSLRNAQSGAAGGTAHRPGLRWVVALAVIALTIAPWTYRNALVTGRFIPVHSGGVTQFVKGNLEFEHYHEAPLQSTQLARIAETRLAQMLGLSGQFDVRSEGLDQALLPFAVESLSHQLDRVLAKVAVQVLRFWYLSDTALKSWVLAVCQIPLLVLGGCWRCVRIARQAPGMAGVACAAGQHIVLQPDLRSVARRRPLLYAGGAVDHCPGGCWLSGYCATTAQGNVAWLTSVWLSITITTETPGYGATPRG
jgi:hypothetical protein